MYKKSKGLVMGLVAQAKSQELLDIEDLFHEIIEKAKKLKLKDDSDIINV